MKNGLAYRYRLIVIILATFYPFSCQNQGSEKPPIIENYNYMFPEQLFQPGIVSTGLHEHSGFDVSPMGQSAFWTVSLNGQKIIFESQLTSNKWITPRVAFFSGQFRDEYHFFSPDGKNVFFNSYRPDTLGGEIPKKFSHYRVTKIGNKWSEPSKHNLWHPELWPYSMDSNRNVYGWASLDTMKTDADIYIQRYENQRYLKPEKLPVTINSHAIEYCPEVSQDGKLLFFCRMGSGESDGIYKSEKEEGQWSTAVRLPESVNQGYAERFPKYDDHNQRLYFNRQVFKFESSSNTRLCVQDILDIAVQKPQNGKGDIYFIDFNKLWDSVQ